MEGESEGEREGWESEREEEEPLNEDGAGETREKLDAVEAEEGDRRRWTLCRAGF